jgi:exoribonuclease II
MATTQSEKPSVLGRSLQLVNGDFAFRDNDFALIAGRDNFIQALQVMIETPTGSDIFNVSYGFDLLNSISAPKTVAQIKDLIRLNIVKSLSIDNRVKEIKEVVFSDDPRFFEIRPELNEQEESRLRKRERRWQAVVSLVTIEDSEVALSLEGRGL